MDEEQLKQKEQEELRALLDSPDEEESSDANKDTTKPTEDADKDKDKDKKPEPGKDEIPNNEGAEDDSGKDSKTKDKDKENKDRWNGKSREEVIKEYETLESRVAALENKKPDEKDKPEDGKSKDNEEENLNLPSADELQKMTPSDFAKWVISRIDDGVKKTIETQEKIRESVRKEIAEANEKHKQSLLVDWDDQTEFILGPLWDLI